MLEGEPDLKVFHLIVKYNNMFMAKGMRGQVIAFLGDRPETGRPMMVTFKDKPWTWPLVKYCMDTVLLETFYSVEQNQGTLLQVPITGQLEEKMLPRLVTIPLCMVEWVVAESRTPNDLRIRI